MSHAPVQIPAVSSPRAAQGAALRGDWVQLDWTGDQEFFSEWRNLTSLVEHVEPFYQPEWFRAFAQAFVPHATPSLLVVRSEEGLHGVAPLMRTRSFFGGVPARAIRSLSGIHSCRYDLVADTARRGQVVAEMWRVLRNDSSWDVIELEDVLTAGTASQLIEQAAADGFHVGYWPTRRSPYMQIPEGGRDPFAECPADFKSIRKRFPNKLRKLKQEHGDVAFEVETVATEEAFRCFLMLESAGWKGTNRSSIVSSTPTMRFYETIVDDLQPQGGVRIYSLRAGSKVIAMHLGLTKAGVYYSPKVAYDESFASFSPGQLLNQYVIGDLSQNGFHTYEFMGPRAWWKCVWTLRVRIHRNCYIFRPNLRGSALHAMTMRAAKMLRRVKRTIRGDPQEVIWGGKVISTIEEGSDEGR